VDEEAFLLDAIGFPLSSEAGAEYFAVDDFQWDAPEVADEPGRVFEFTGADVTGAAMVGADVTGSALVGADVTGFAFAGSVDT
jgi:uncharacterized protein YjbI with pentapeptide repeats